MNKKLAAVLAVFVLATLFAGCGAETPRDPKKIAVFVPGIAQNSPLYSMMVEGAQKAVDATAGATLKVLEAGFDQSKWLEQLTALASEPGYGLIVTSNSVMPELCAKVAAKVPGIKFLVLDGAKTVAGNDRIYVLQYNQRQQAYMAGYLAGLLTKSGAPGMSPALKVGLIAAQSYPVLDNIIKPGFLEGALAAAPGTELDFRYAAGWGDSAGVQQLADSMIDAGVDVILPIAGGGGLSAPIAAKARGAKVIWFDSNGYAIEKGTVAGSAVLNQDRAALEKVLLYFAGALPFGAYELYGVAEGYVDFIQDDPDYVATVPAGIRAAQAAMIEAIRAGTILLPQE